LALRAGSPGVAAPAGGSPGCSGPGRGCPALHRVGLPAQARTQPSVLGPWSRRLAVAGPPGGGEQPTWNCCGQGESNWL